jgi:integrase
MEEIRRQDCIRLHATISASEGQPLVEANRCLEIVQAMFTRAELEGAISEGHYNPVAGLDFHSEESRTRYLDQLELKRLEKALRAEPLHIQCMVRLFLLLGLRKSELLSMPWSAVKIGHPEGDHIDVSRTKNGRALKLALSPECVAVFDKLRELQGYHEKTRNNSWVFPSRWKGYEEPVQDFRRYWRRLRDVANLRDCTAHDLRRTCGSIMIQNGVPIEYVSRVLNHTSSEITRVYARMSQDNQREALGVASQVLNGIFGKIAA